MKKVNKVTVSELSYFISSRTYMNSEKCDRLCYDLINHEDGYSSTELDKDDFLDDKKMDGRQYPFLFRYGILLFMELHKITELTINRD